LLSTERNTVFGLPVTYNLLPTIIGNTGVSFLYPSIYAALFINTTWTLTRTQFLSWTLPIFPRRLGATFNRTCWHRT